jgi:hypothetical protein
MLEAAAVVDMYGVQEQTVKVVGQNQDLVEVLVQMLSLQILLMVQEHLPQIPIQEAGVAAEDMLLHRVEETVAQVVPVSSFSKCNQLKVDQSLGHSQALVFGDAQQVF